MAVKRKVKLKLSAETPSNRASFTAPTIFTSSDIIKKVKYVRCLSLKKQMNYFRYLDITITKSLNMTVPNHNQDPPTKQDREFLCLGNQTIRFHLPEDQVFLPLPLAHEGRH